MVKQQSPTEVATEKHISESMLVTWYEALLNRFNTVNNAITSIDNKTSIILAAAVAVLIFGVEKGNGEYGILRVIGMFGLILSVVLSLININLREAPGEVNSTEDRPDYYYRKDGEFIWQLIADLEQSIAGHAAVNRKKARVYRFLTLTFSIASIFLLVANYIDITVTISNQ